jgi:UPF0755 protein
MAGRTTMKRSPMWRAFRIFALTTVMGVVGAGAVIYKFWTYPDNPAGHAQGTVEVTIPRGATARGVGDILVAAGVLENPTLFRLYASQRGAASRFKAGRYQIKAPITPRALIDQIVKGAGDELVLVTVPEGRNMLEVAELLSAAKVAPAADLFAKAIDPGFVRELGLPGQSLEGYLFPDSYRLRPGTEPARVLLTLVRRHREVFEELRVAHSDGLASLHKKLGWGDKEVVIMASIVEKETGQPQERPRIAQVFINRLTLPTFKPRLLQTDPTIIYGCTIAPKFLGRSSDACTKFEDRIRRIHLDDRENPFSTYAHEGLPPGPIANPGREALAAVMKPDGTKYLYFVSKNDGTHQFSADRVAHDAAVIKYQRGGKALPANATP